MKLKASFFSLSKPLIVENLRRFWAIPALAFLFYFLSGAFPILMSYKHLNKMANYIELSLNNQQPFFMMAHLIFPIVAAIIVFRYLQGASSVSVMHAMPFTKAELYGSNFISGLIMIVSPILVNGLILLAISKPVYDRPLNSVDVAATAVNLFSRSEVLSWIWVSIIITFTIYVVSVFSGMVSGNSLMHCATAIGFNFLFPILYSLFTAYCAQFLYGFDMAETWLSYGLKISPYLSAIQNGNNFGLIGTIIYIISFFFVLILTGFLYQKRKLERVTDSLVFHILEPIICYLIAFMGMTLLGFYFDALGDASFYLYAGFAAGTLIFFIIGQMIVKKTPRIFNLQSLRSLGIYCLIAIVFILSLALDATGFENRIPAENKIKSISYEDSFGRIHSYDYMENYGNYPLRGTEFAFKTPENIQAVRDLHQSILENRARFEDQTGILTGSIPLTYNPDSRFPTSRRYIVDYDFYRSNQHLKTLYESAEWKDYYAPSNLQYLSLEGIYVNSPYPYSESVILSGDKDLSEFMACLDKDFKAQTYEDMIRLKHSYALVSIDFKYIDQNNRVPGEVLTNSVTYPITESFANTISWLDRHGYSDGFRIKPEQVAFVSIYHHVEKDADEDEVYDGSMTTVFPDGDEEDESITITNLAQIEDVLNRYDDQNINYNDYYYGVVVYKNESNPQETEEITKLLNGREIAKEDIDSISSATMTVYFNEGNIPDYILDSFQ